MQLETSVGHVQRYLFGLLTSIKKWKMIVVLSAQQNHISQHLHLFSTNDLDDLRLIMIYG